MNPFDYFGRFFGGGEQYRVRRTESALGGTEQALRMPVVTVGPDGSLVGYRGLSLREIESYGWIERAVDMKMVPDSLGVKVERQGSKVKFRRKLSSAYDLIQARKEARREMYEGWDPDDPNPENPWNKEDDTEEVDAYIEKRLSHIFVKPQMWILDDPISDEEADELVDDWMDDDDDEDDGL